MYNCSPSAVASHLSDAHPRFSNLDPYLLKLFNFFKKIWLLLLNTAEIISTDVSNLQFVTLKDLSASQHPHSWHSGEFPMFFLTYPCSLSVSLSITCFCSSLSPLSPPMSLLARFTSACQSTVSPCLCSWDFCARDLRWSPPLPCSPSLSLAPLLAPAVSASYLKQRDQNGPLTSPDMWRLLFDVLFLLMERIHLLFSKFY